MTKRLLLLLLLSLPPGLSADVCDRALQDKYCAAPYGGDLHTGCRYCGLGLQCPLGNTGGPSGRGLNAELQKEIVRRHNDYREEVRAMQGDRGRCIPDLSWDNELAEVAQVWADQCAGVVYQQQGKSRASSDPYPKLYHERGVERVTSRFRGPPGVGQNIAWALTAEVNFTRIIDDLWYRDISQVEPAFIGDFEQIANQDRDMTLVTQILWGRTTHVGCGWTQFPLLASSPARKLANSFSTFGNDSELFENFFVCNYGVGGNVIGQPVFDCNSSSTANVSSPVRTLVLKYGDMMREAPEATRLQVQDCLDAAAACNSGHQQQMCLEKQAKCFPQGRQPNEEVSPAVLARIDCRIDFLLCLLSDSQSSCQIRQQQCHRSNAISTTTTTPLPATTTTSTTTMRSTTAAPTSRPVTIASSAVSDGLTTMSGSTSMDISSEVTTVVTAAVTGGEELRDVEGDKAAPLSSTQKTTSASSLQSPTEREKQEKVTTTTRPSQEIDQQSGSIVSSETTTTMNEAISAAAATTTEHTNDSTVLSSAAAVAASVVNQESKTTSDVGKQPNVSTSATPNFIISSTRKPEITTKVSFTDHHDKNGTTQEDEIHLSSSTPPSTTSERPNTNTTLAVGTSPSPTVASHSPSFSSSEGPTTSSGISESFIPAGHKNTKNVTDHQISTTTAVSEVTNGDFFFFNRSSVNIPPPTEVVDSSESKLDISFYNSTAKSTLRLAVCLEGIRCEVDSDQCRLLHDKCNEGVNVTGVPFKVRRKLSECNVDDILCHLDGRYSISHCQQLFQACADIVIPDSMRLHSLVTPPTTAAANTTEFDPFLFLLGLAEVNNNTHGKPSGGLINNLTTNVLSSINDVFDGIEVTGVAVNGSIDDYTKSNNTIPIFQDVFIILNDDAKTVNESTSVVVMVNGTAVKVDLANPNVVFSPLGITVGGQQGNISEDVRRTLTEKIAEKFAEVATKCPHCGGEATSDTTPFTLRTTDTTPRTTPRTTTTITRTTFTSTTSTTTSTSSTPSSTSTIPHLPQHILVFPSTVQLQVQLAVCLSGVECAEANTCLQAQRKCLGDEKIEQKYNPRERVEIAECIVENYLCQLGGNNRAFTFCEKGLHMCLKNMTATLENESNASLNSTLSGLIQQIAENVTAIARDRIDMTLKIKVQTSQPGSSNEPTTNIWTLQEEADGVEVMFHNLPVNADRPFILVQTKSTDKTEFDNLKVKGRIEDALRSILSLYEKTGETGGTKKGITTNVPSMIEDSLTDGKHKPASEDLSITIKNDPSVQPGQTNVKLEQLGQELVAEITANVPGQTQGVIQKQKESIQDLVVTKPAAEEKISTTAGSGLKVDEQKVKDIVSGLVQSTVNKNPTAPVVSQHDVDAIGTKLSGMIEDSLTDGKHKPASEDLSITIKNDPSVQPGQTNVKLEQLGQELVAEITANVPGQTQGVIQKQKESIQDLVVTKPAAEEKISTTAGSGLKVDEQKVKDIVSGLVQSTVNKNPTAPVVSQHNVDAIGTKLSGMIEDSLTDGKHKPASEDPSITIKNDPSVQPGQTNVKLEQLGQELVAEITANVPGQTQGVIQKQKESIQDLVVTKPAPEEKISTTAGSGLKVDEQKVKDIVNSLVQSTVNKNPTAPFVSQHDVDAIGTKLSGMIEDSLTDGKHKPASEDLSITIKNDPSVQPGQTNVKLEQLGQELVAEIPANVPGQTQGVIQKQKESIQDLVVTKPAAEEKIGATAGSGLKVDEQKVKDIVSGLVQSTVNKNPTAPVVSQHDVDAIGFKLSGMIEDSLTHGKHKPASEDLSITIKNDPSVQPGQTNVKLEQLGQELVAEITANVPGQTQGVIQKQKESIQDLVVTKPAAEEKISATAGSGLKVDEQKVKDIVSGLVQSTVNKNPTAPVVSQHDVDAIGTKLSGMIEDSLTHGKHKPASEDLSITIKNDPSVQPGQTNVKLEQLGQELVAEIIANVPGQTQGVIQKQKESIQDLVVTKPAAEEKISTTAGSGLKVDEQKVKDIVSGLVQSTVNKNPTAPVVSQHDVDAIGFKLSGMIEDSLTDGKHKPASGDLSITIKNDPSVQPGQTNVKLEQLGQELVAEITANVPGQTQGVIQKQKESIQDLVVTKPAAEEKIGATAGSGLKVDEQKVKDIVSGLVQSTVNKNPTAPVVSQHDVDAIGTKLSGMIEDSLTDGKHKPASEDLSITIKNDPSVQPGQTNVKLEQLGQELVAEITVNAPGQTQGVIQKQKESIQDLVVTKPAAEEKISTTAGSGLKVDEQKVKDIVSGLVQSTVNKNPTAPVVSQHDVDAIGTKLSGMIEDSLTDGKHKPASEDLSITIKNDPSVQPGQTNVKLEQLGQELVAEITANVPGQTQGVIQKQKESIQDLVVTKPAAEEKISATAGSGLKVDEQKVKDIVSGLVQSTVNKNPTAPVVSQHDVDAIGTKLSGMIEDSLTHGKHKPASEDLSITIKNDPSVQPGQTNVKLEQLGQELVAEIIANVPGQTQGVIQKQKESIQDLVVTKPAAEEKISTTAGSGLKVDEQKVKDIVSGLVQSTVNKNPTAPVVSQHDVDAIGTKLSGMIEDSLTDGKHKPASEDLSITIKNDPSVQPGQTNVKLEQLGQELVAEITANVPGQTQGVIQKQKESIQDLVVTKPAAEKKISTTAGSGLKVDEQKVKDIVSGLVQSTVNKNPTAPVVSQHDVDAIGTKLSGMIEDSLTNGKHKPSSEELDIALKNDPGLKPGQTNVTLEQSGQELVAEISANVPNQSNGIIETNKQHVKDLVVTKPAAEEKITNTGGTGLQIDEQKVKDIVSGLVQSTVNKNPLAPVVSQHAANGTASEEKLSNSADSGLPVDKDKVKNGISDLVQSTVNKNITSLTTPEGLISPTHHSLVSRKILFDLRNVTSSPIIKEEVLESIAEVIQASISEHPIEDLKINLIPILSKDDIEQVIGSQFLSNVPNDDMIFVFEQELPFKLQETAQQFPFPLDNLKDIPKSEMRNALKATARRIINDIIKTVNTKTTEIVNNNTSSEATPAASNITASNSSASVENVVQAIVEFVGQREGILKLTPLAKTGAIRASLGGDQIDVPVDLPIKQSPEVEIALKPGTVADQVMREIQPFFATISTPQPFEMHLPSLGFSITTKKEEETTKTSETTHATAQTEEDDGLSEASEQQPLLDVPAFGLSISAQRNATGSGFASGNVTTGNNSSLPATDSSSHRNASHINATVGHSISTAPSSGVPSATNPPPSPLATTSTAAEVTSPENPQQGPGILERIRNIVVGLVATTITGLVSNSFSLPITPARKEDNRPTFFLPRKPPQLPPNIKDPRDRPKNDNDEVFFDGNVLNITLPVQPEEIRHYEKSKLENDVGNVVEDVLRDSFHEDTNDAPPKLQVMVSEDPDGRRIFINAQTNSSVLPAATGGKQPQQQFPEQRVAAEATTPGTRDLTTPDNIFSPSESGLNEVTTNHFVQQQSTFVGNLKPTSSEGSRIPPSFESPAEEVKNSGNVPDGNPHQNVLPDGGGGGTRDHVLRFEAKDAITLATPTITAARTTTATTEATLLQLESNATFSKAVADSEGSQVFDNRQNSILSGSGSSANVVEATVVEDFDYARRVRDSSSSGSNVSIGIATISSITIGLIALLIFGLLIFMAVARRRRRRQFSTATTPSSLQSTPILADSPSISDARTSYLEDFASGPSSLQPQDPPVLPIDGHQTIVSSYGDFLSGAAGTKSSSSILQSLPPPSLSETAKVPKTLNLSDDGDYLFVRRANNSPV